MLYTKDGSYPKPIPERIRLSDGSTRTDSSTFTPEEISDAGFTLAPDKPVLTAMQRMYWDGSQWVVVDIPMWEIREKMVVSMRQARLALLQANKLSLVDDAIALIPEPDHSAIKVEWEYANTVERNSPWMGTMGQALGMTDEDLDNLFQIAEGL